MTKKGPWTAQKLRELYIEFFRTKKHVVVPSASLVPENDPTILFTTAGMHPLVPYLLGETHPSGTRLVGCQRCIRTGDIDLVGDDVHLTFFEMLGNWSLGDYWKKEAIGWSWEFLTNRKWLALDPTRIYVTCFAGDENAPRDDESACAWKSIGVPEDHIAFLGKKDNWWGPVGDTGPCGPDTEMFYRINESKNAIPEGTQWPQGAYVEIWNDVFMEYSKNRDGSYTKLKRRNVDTGMGVERTLAVLQEKQNVFQTELFSIAYAIIAEKSKKINERSARIIVDHCKAALFLLADGVLPSNKDQGYITRRLIRKAITKGFELAFIGNENYTALLKSIISTYATEYPFMVEKQDSIIEEFKKEETKFVRTLERGLKIVQEQLSIIHKDASSASRIAFDMNQTFGFPPDLTFDLLTEHKAITISRDAFDSQYEEFVRVHRNVSRKGATKKFQSGLADHSDRVIRMHTATHILHQALKDVLGKHVVQRGSNITNERLRFDFTHPRKVTDDELKKVQEIVNTIISDGLEVQKHILSINDARSFGATGIFNDKYGETVSVFSIGNYSKEFCSGPHVRNTREIGVFQIQKEEAVSSGVRRIKAVVL